MLEPNKTAQDLAASTPTTWTEEENLLANEVHFHERNLRASELSYRRLFESARDGILILDVDSGCVTDVNPYLVELLGFSHSEMVGKTVGELSPFKDILQNENILDQLQEIGYVRYEHLPLETRDGRKIEVEFVSNVYQAGDKKVIQCNIRDITERKRSEAALKESRRFLRATLDALSLHIAILDADGTIIEVNAAWKQFASDNHFVGSESCIHTNYLDICDKASGTFSEEAPVVAAGIRSVIAGECELFTLEYPCHSEDEKRWFILRITRFNGKGPERVVVAHENISERKSLEQQFRQSQKMEAIGTLAGGVAHDFNNILGIIQMQADLLISLGHLSNAQLEVAEDIGKAVERAAGLTHQLLTFSRKEILQLRDMDLNQSVTEMTKMLTRILGEDIAIVLKLSSEPVFLYADEGMMDQVVMNLAVNARDAMPDGGQLLIETTGVDFDVFAARQIE
jgi:PAS domain S-box-containing protein